MRVWHSNQHGMRVLPRSESPWVEQFGTLGFATFIYMRGSSKTNIAL